MALPYLTLDIIGATAIEQVGLQENRLTFELISLENRIANELRTLKRPLSWHNIFCGLGPCPAMDFYELVKVWQGVAACSQPRKSNKYDNYRYCSILVDNITGLTFNDSFPFRLRGS